MHEYQALHGCRIQVLSTLECHHFIKWVNDGPKPDKMGSDILWLLAHMVDGVTWGKLNDNGNWVLGSTIFPELCPIIRADNLLEVRLFGPKKEIFIWSHDEGLKGRLLEDDLIEKKGSCVTPDDEVRILLGNRLIEGPRDGLSRVGTGNGREQVVPLECSQDDFSGGRWPLRLKVRHYFKTDEDTGAVYVAATRLVDVYKEAMQ